MTALGDVWVVVERPFAPHEVPGGVEALPNIFFKETLPLTCSFALAFEEGGSSGNKEVGSFGEGFRLFN